MVYVSTLPDVALLCAHVALPGLPNISDSPMPLCMGFPLSGVPFCLSLSTHSSELILLTLQSCVPSARKPSAQPDQAELSACQCFPHILLQHISHCRHSFWAHLSPPAACQPLPGICSSQSCMPHVIEAP